MVNLDATPDFTAVTPVLSGETGPYSGEFPAGWSRPTSTTFLRRSASPGVPLPSTIVRAGYGVTYNAGSYSTIARQLVEPAAVRDHEHELGTVVDPLDAV